MKKYFLILALGIMFGCSTTQTCVQVSPVAKRKIIETKLFLVLCCQEYNGQYRYEVKTLDGTGITGITFSSAQYSEGDTIRIDN